MLTWWISVSGISERMTIGVGSSVVNALFEKVLGINVKAINLLRSDKKKSDF